MWLIRCECCPSGIALADTVLTASAGSARPTTVARRSRMRTPLSMRDPGASYRRRSIGSRDLVSKPAPNIAIPGTTIKATTRLSQGTLMGYGDGAGKASANCRFNVYSTAVDAPSPAITPAVRGGQPGGHPGRAERDHPGGDGQNHQGLIGGLVAPRHLNRVVRAHR